MKYIKLFIFTIVLFFILIINCYAVELDTTNNSDVLSIQENQKLFDFADIYSKKEEKKLNKKIDSYIKSTDIDVIIVTTNRLDGRTISEYTNAFYQKNNFKENTVLFVIFINEIEPQIFMYSSGDNSTKYYSNERTGEILEYTYNYIEKKEYYKATDKFITIIQGFYDLDNKTGNYYLDDNGNIVKIIPWLEIFILSLALTFIIVMIFIYRINHNNKITKINALDDKLDNDRLVVSTVKDELVDTVVSK